MDLKTRVKFAFQHFALPRDVGFPPLEREVVPDPLEAGDAATGEEASKALSEALPEDSPSAGDGSGESPGMSSTAPSRSDAPLGPAVSVSPEPADRATPSATASASIDRPRDVGVGGKGPDGRPGEALADVPGDSGLQEVPQPPIGKVEVDEVVVAKSLRQMDGSRGEVQSDGPRVAPGGADTPDLPGAAPSANRSRRPPAPGKEEVFWLDELDLLRPESTAAAGPVVPHHGRQAALRHLQRWLRSSDKVRPEQENPSAELLHADPQATSADARVSPSASRSESRSSEVAAAPASPAASAMPLEIEIETGTADQGVQARAARASEEARGEVSTVRRSGPAPIPHCMRDLPAPTPSPSAATSESPTEIVVDTLLIEIAASPSAPAAAPTPGERHRLPTLEQYRRSLGSILVI
jgi:hypothetical protein